MVTAKVYIVMIIRCVFSKGWPCVVPPVNLALGRFSVEKIKDLGHCWAKVVDHKHPGLNFAAMAGLLVDDKDDLGQKEDNQEVDLGALRKLTKSISDGPDPELGPKFKACSAVTVVKRVTWQAPQPDAPEFRKDLSKGTEGVIVGFADLGQRQVILRVVMDLPSGPRQTITHQTFPQEAEAHQ